MRTHWLMLGLILLVGCTADLDDDGLIDIADGGTDCDDSNATVFPGAPELCDGLDNDCDDVIDEDAGDKTWFTDADGDGFGVDEEGVRLCDGSNTDGLADTNTDCDDSNRAVHPNATEDCSDGIDNNCDGTVDETGGIDTWYPDADADGFGDPENAVTECPPPNGPVFVTVGGDCDDTKTAVNPDARERCATEHDDDCDGTLGNDPVDGTTFYADADGDSYGDENITVSECVAPEGYVEATTLFDCDDANAAIRPGVPEVCDSIDNNCDTIIDDSADPAFVSNAWKLDLDADGVAGDDPDAEALFQCADPSTDEATYAQVSPGDLLDCADDDASVTPGTTELCNGLDDNCADTSGDGNYIDEGLDRALYGLDTDGDGVPADNAPAELMCAAPDPEWVLWSSVYEGDCSPDDPSLYYGDNLWVPDCDGDGFGNQSAGPVVVNCGPPKNPPTTCGGSSAATWVYWFDHQKRGNDCNDASTGVGTGTGC